LFLAFKKAESKPPTFYNPNHLSLFVC